MIVRALVVIAALLSSGCAKRYLPGTEIEDTPQTQEILSVIRQYVSAVEAQDAEALMALVSTDFEDNAGTSTPEDDLDYRNLPEALRARFAAVDRLRMDVEVRDIEVREEQASATYYYTLRYETPNLEQRVHTASEIKRMRFKRADGRWKIVSGI